MRQRECLAFGVMVLIFCLLSLLFIRDAQAADESLTLETYYPAPYGAYAELTTTGNTSLATDTGSVGIGTTSPQAKLDVDGGIKVGNDTNCNPQKAGTMMYNSGSVQYCNGSGWQTMGGGISYTYYCFSSNIYGTPVCTNAGGTQGYCPSGYTQKLSLGSWGTCPYSDNSCTAGPSFLLPPGGSCGCISGTYVVGNAYVCSQ